MPKFGNVIKLLFAGLIGSAGLVYSNADRVANYCARKDVPIVRSMLEDNAQERFIKEALQDVEITIQEEIDKQKVGTKWVTELATTEEGRNKIVKDTIVSTIKKEFKQHHVSFEFFKWDNKFFHDSLGLNINWKNRGAIATLRLYYNLEVEQVRTGPAFAHFNEYVASESEKELKAYVSEKASGKVRVFLAVLTTIVAAGILYGFLRKRKRFGR
jgi:hypothetical protein